MVGFHANYLDKCNDFVSNGTLIVDDKDTSYLGAGMYFWSNLSQAKWWKSEKHKDRIVKAVIDIDNENRLLDLGDSEYLERLEQMFNFIRQGYNKMARKYGLSNNIESYMGCKLNFIFDFYKQFEEQIDVVKGIYVIGDEESTFCWKTKFSKKCIEMLCVRHKDVINNRSFVNG